MGDVRELAASLGPVGLWTATFDFHPTDDVRRAVAEIEQLGFPALWTPESRGREAFSKSAVLLAATSTLVVATGIASIWARDATATESARKTLGDAFPGRFVLGLGVSHADLASDMRGHDYRKPLSRMKVYLSEMDASVFFGSAPEQLPPVVIAALGPRMLELARDQTDGAHTYLATTAHTAVARGVLGEGKLLAVEQAVVLTTDYQRGLRIAREHVARYAHAINYSGHFERLGYSKEQIESLDEALVSDLVAWGDEAVVRSRIDEQLAAGADHVCVQVLADDPYALPLPLWRELQPALLA